MSFSVLFVCICVLNYCHRVATQLQLTNISNHRSTLTDQRHALEHDRYTEGMNKDPRDEFIPVLSAHFLCQLLLSESNTWLNKTQQTFLQVEWFTSDCGFSLLSVSGSNRKLYSGNPPERE